MTQEYLIRWFSNDNTLRKKFHCLSSTYVRMDGSLSHVFPIFHLLIEKNCAWNNNITFVPKKVKMTVKVNYKGLFTWCVSNCFSFR